MPPKARVGPDPGTSNRSKKAQIHVIEEKLEEMVLWYAALSGGKIPDIAVDDQSYKGKGLVLRWLVPLLPGEENPLLIEESLGDSWTLRLVPLASSDLVKV